MKTIFTIIALVAFASVSFAGQYGGTGFALYSGVSSAAVTSSAISVRGFNTKTITVTGTTLTSNASSATYKNMSGTLIAQCGPTSSGPWSTCTQSQVASAPAVSLTTNNQLSWKDAVAYVRIKWTASANATGQKIKAWLNWNED